ncbi:S1C family serine protease [Acrocarpospora catenulata]|uniref:S1C family serine protease n=1 Tax=Acrocarpospora catenulata TaxID=2836182 RepID=UPI001BD9306D|nr:trypsin-like peptidase domain-containing protein [Acrocarpospora catenulata]
MTFSPAITQVAARSALTVTVTAALLGGACAACAGSYGGGGATPGAGASPRTGQAHSKARSQSPVDVPSAAAAVEAAYEQVIKKVLPSIVQITTGNELGSGVVFDTDGHIVTNAHVVGESQRFQVSLATGGQARPATLVGTFPAGDLAVIKVADPSGLAPAAFGDSGKLQVGQMVLAMGNPLGFSGTVTQGIVSALGRTVSGEEENGVPGATIADAIQTSAAINRGNSGGALVDLSARVVGIPTLAAVDPQLGAAPGIGFAIPSATASDIANQLIKNGRVVNSRRAALGVRVGTAIGSNGEPAGVVVGTVTPGGGAAKAGIRPGDVITAVNDTPTPTTTALSQLLATLTPGKQAKVTLQRPNGQTETLTVTLGQLPGGP